MPRPSGLCRITYRPTPPAPCIRRSRPPKLGGSCGGSSSTTPQSTQAGSTWLRSRSASCGNSASLAGSTTPSDCVAKSPLGNAREMLRVPASNGCLRQKRPGTKWGGLTQTRPKSHNHCAEVLDLLALHGAGDVVRLADRERDDGQRRIAGGAAGELTAT